MPNFVSKLWKAKPDVSTPLNASGLNDLEARIAALESGVVSQSDGRYVHQDGTGIPASTVRVSGPDTGLNAGARIQVAHEAPLNPLWPEYAATFDGTTDDTAAWTALFAALPSRGGEIYVPPVGTSIVSQLTVPINSTDVTIRGGGGHNSGGSCRLLSHYAGSGAVLTANAAAGLRMTGLSVYNDAAGFTGKLVDLSKGAGSKDTTQFKIADARFQAVAQSGSSVRLLQLTKATIGRIEGVYFNGGAYGVEGLTTGGDYCNSITIGDGCTFQNQDLCPIHNLGGQCRIVHATFEPLRSGAAGMYLQDAALPGDVLLIDGNWTGDVTAGGTWIVFNGQRLDLVRGALNGGSIGVQLNGTTRALAVATHFNGTTTAIDLNGKTVNVFDPRGSSFGDPITTMVTAGATGMDQGGAGNNLASGAVQVNLTGTKSLTTATATAVTFDAANFDTSGGRHWAVGSPTRLTCVIPGLYRVYGTLVYDVNTTGDRATWFKVNGTTWLPGTRAQANSGGAQRSAVQASTSVFLNTGDYVECYGLQGSGGALNVLINDPGIGTPTVFGMERLS